MNFLVILGTARKNRKTIKITEIIMKKIKKTGINSELIDVKNYALKATDNTKKTSKAKKFAEKIIKSNGIIIVSPEYNHFFPGELKILLDMLYFEYKNKPVLLIGTSKGEFGGQRMLKQLQLQVLALKMIPFPETIHVPLIEKPISKQLIQKIEKTINEFKKFTEKNS